MNIQRLSMECGVRNGEGEIQIGIAIAIEIEMNNTLGE